MKNIQIKKMNKKVNMIQKSLQKSKKNVSIDLDIIEEDLKFIKKIAKKYNTTQEVILNIILREMIIKIEKNKAMESLKKETILENYEENFQNEPLIDSIEFSEKLLKNKLTKEEYQIIDYISLKTYSFFKN